MRNDKLSELVIELHNIAGQVERECGKIDVSEKLRRCADDLHVISVNYHREQASRDENTMG
jgi:hypothetical protein